MAQLWLLSVSVKMKMRFYFDSPTPSLPPSLPPSPAHHIYLPTTTPIFKLLSL